MPHTDQRFLADKYYLNQSLKLVRMFTVIAGMFNLFLIIPDLSNTGREAAYIVLGLRLGFAFLALVFLILINKINTFSGLAVIVTSFEVLAIIQFLIILLIYPDPDFMIQLLSFMILMVFVILVPNYWAMVVSITCLGSVCFLGFAYFVFSRDLTQLGPGAVYLGLLSVTGAVYKRYSLLNQRRDIKRILQMQQILGTDPLTAAGNRNLLIEIGEELLEKANMQGLKLALIFIDVDDLKQINDAYGHSYGDLLLKEIAGAIRRALRHDDICVRWGGDEFVLFLSGISLADAVKLAERIRDDLRSHVYENKVSPTCSFGIAALKPGQSLEALIEEADQAMYEAKKDGKNAVSVSSFSGEK